MKSMNSCYERLQQSYEDFKANNQWLVEEYWEWYYKWNDVYRQVMSYPEAQQMKAIVSEVLQTVSRLMLQAENSVGQNLETWCRNE